MKKILVFLIILMLGVSIGFAAEEAQKEKKIYWNFSVGYGLTLDANSIRPSWDIGYLRFYKGRTPLDYTIDLLREPWLAERWWQCYLQQAPAPDGYYVFILNGKVPEFYLRAGDRVILGGYSRTKYQNVIPQLSIGWDIRLTKRFFFSLNLFGRHRQDELRVEEEGYTIFVKQVWGPYYELDDQQTRWRLDTVIEHYLVNLKMNLWNFGIVPWFKFEIALGKHFSLFPKVGAVLSFCKSQAKADWLLNYLSPFDYVFSLMDPPNFYNESKWVNTKKKTDFVVAPIAGLDIRIKGLILGAEIQFGAGKQFPVTEDLYYNSSLAKKARFVVIDEYYHNQYVNFRRGYYGTPQFNDFIKLNKAMILKFSIGGRF